MDPIEIPITTPLGKAPIVTLSMVVVLVGFYWLVPRLRTFLETLVTRQELKGLGSYRMAIGVLIYALIVLVLVIMAFTSVSIATAQPARISERGIAASVVSCQHGVGVFALSCSASLSPFRVSTQEIRWGEIDGVDCLNRVDGSVREMRIRTSAKHIEITSLVLHDLSGALEVIRSHAPKGTVSPCHLDTD